MHAHTHTHTRIDIHQFMLYSLYLPLLPQFFVVCPQVKVNWFNVKRNSLLILFTVSFTFWWTAAARVCVWVFMCVCLCVLIVYVSVCPSVIPFSCCQVKAININRFKCLWMSLRLRPCHALRIQLQLLLTIIHQWINLNASISQYTLKNSWNIKKFKILFKNILKKIVETRNSAARLLYTQYILDCLPKL